MPRPARKSDANLAAQVDAHLKNQGISATKLAKSLNISVSTLTRSMKLKEFSKGLSEKLSKELDGNYENPVESLHKALHILAEVDRIRSEVEMTVRRALNRLEAAR